MNGCIEIYEIFPGFFWMTFIYTDISLHYCAISQIVQRCFAENTGDKTLKTQLGVVQYSTTSLPSATSRLLCSDVAARSREWPTWHNSV